MIEKTLNLALEVLLARLLSHATLLLIADLWFWGWLRLIRLEVARSDRDDLWGMLLPTPPRLVWYRDAHPKGRNPLSPAGIVACVVFIFLLRTSFPSSLYYSPVLLILYPPSPLLSLYSSFCCLGNLQVYRHRCKRGRLRWNLVRGAIENERAEWCACTTSESAPIASSSTMNNILMIIDSSL